MTRFTTMSIFPAMIKEAGLNKQWNWKLLCSVCYQNSAENRQKIEMFKERFLPLIILWSSSIWSQFKAHDLFFWKVLTEYKSKLYFNVNYSLPKATYCADCRGGSYFSACTIVSKLANKWNVKRAFYIINNHLIFKHLVLI